MRGALSLVCRDKQTPPPSAILLARNVETLDGAVVIDPEGKLVANCDCCPI